MSIHDFHSSSLGEKERILSLIGCYLDTMHYMDFDFHLFSLGNYFIQVKVNAQTGEIFDIDIAKGEWLDRFINKIQLPASLQ